MKEFLAAIFSSVFGVSLSGIAGISILTLVRIVSRHSILIHGSVTPQNKAGQDRALTRFRFRLQNLEEVQYPGKFSVTIRAALPSSSVNTPELRVFLFAGPQRVTVKRTVGDEISSNDSRIVQWQAKFDTFPPYDAWLFDCESNCDVVQLLIDTGQAGNWVTRRLKLDLHPSSLTLSSRSRKNRYAGFTSAPPYWIFYFSCAVSLLVYTATTYRELRTQQDWGIFASISLGIVALLWLAFRLLRRPVYPIIQGYLAATMVVAESATTAMSEDNVTKTITGQGGLSQSEG